MRWYNDFAAGNHTKYCRSILYVCVYIYKYILLLNFNVFLWTLANFLLWYMYIINCLYLDCDELLLHIPFPWGINKVFIIIIIIIYKYINICVYVYFICVWIHIYIYIHIYVYIFIFIHIYVCIYVFLYINTHTQHIYNIYI